MVAEVEESWTTPVDVRLREYGLRSDVVEDRFVRHTTALEANLDALDDGLDHASAENRAAMQKDIETVKKQLKQEQAKAKAKLDRLTQNRRRGSRRSKTRPKERVIEPRCASNAAKADFDPRSKKLNQVKDHPGGARHEIVKREFQVALNFL